MKPFYVTSCFLLHVYTSAPPLLKHNAIINVNFQKHLLPGGSCTNTCKQNVSNIIKHSTGQCPFSLIPPCSSPTWKKSWSWAHLLWASRTSSTGSHRAALYEGREQSEENSRTISSELLSFPGFSPMYILLNFHLIKKKNFSFSQWETSLKTSPIWNRVIMRSMLNGMILEQRKSTIIMVTCMCAKSFQSCPTLCNAMDYCSMPGSSIHEILQTRILEWVAMPSSRGSFQPRDQTHVSYVSCTGRQVLYH